MRSVKLEQAKEVTKLRQEVEQAAKELASKYERKMKVSCAMLRAQKSGYKGVDRLAAKKTSLNQVQAVVVKASMGLCICNVMCCTQCDISDFTRTTA